MKSSCCKSLPIITLVLLALHPVACAVAQTPPRDNAGKLHGGGTFRSNELSPARQAGETTISRTPGEAQPQEPQSQVTPPQKAQRPVQSRSNEPDDVSTPSTTASEYPDYIGSPWFPRSETLATLQSVGVFVSPPMRHLADASHIGKTIESAKVKTKVLIIESLPPLPVAGRSVEQLARTMHDSLDLGNGLMILIAGREVAVYGAGLDQGTTLQRITQSAAKTFDSEGYTAGIAQIVRAVDDERARRAAHTRNLVLMIIAVPVVVIWWAAQRSKRQRAAEFAEARASTRDLVLQMASEFEKLDSVFEYAVVRESDAGRKALLQEHRQRMGEAFSTATARFDGAQSTYDFTVVKRDFQAVQSAMQRAREVLRGQTGDGQTGDGQSGDSAEPARPDAPAEKESVEKNGSAEKSAPPVRPPLPA